MERLREAIHAIDGRLRPLTHYGIDLSHPTPARLEELRARADAMRRQLDDADRTRREADALLPAILDRYLNGGDRDREELRALLAECPSFRWGFGWGLAKRIGAVREARDALAVFSLKDGNGDWRDQIVALDHLCAAMRRAGLPVAALLTEAAAWSSDISRFPNAASTRALLRRYAQRFDAEMEKRG